MTALNPLADSISVRTEHGTLRANTLIGADGGRSTIRELAQIETRTHDYEQTAVVTSLRMEQGHANGLATLLPTGPIAVLPLPGDFASIVWSTTPEQAAELLQTDTATFNYAVGDAFDFRRGSVVWSGERTKFPLHRIATGTVLADRIALVGDAAHAAFTRLRVKDSTLVLWTPHQCAPSWLTRNGRSATRVSFDLTAIRTLAGRSQLLPCKTLWMHFGGPSVKPAPWFR